MAFFYLLKTSVLRGNITYFIYYIQYWRMDDAIFIVCLIQSLVYAADWGSTFFPLTLCQRYAGFSGF